MPINTEPNDKMNITFKKVKNQHKFTRNDGKDLYVYPGDYAVTHIREIYIVKRMEWGSKTTAWVAFHFADKGRTFEAPTLRELRETMQYHLSA